MRFKVTFSNVSLYTVKDRDIAQYTNFDLLSDIFNMGQ